MPTVVVVLLFAACSQQRFLDPFKYLVGDWKTEKGIIVSVGMASDTEAEATIKLTPGYRGEEIDIGKVLIHAIKPEASGGFSGLFVMPGGRSPVKVEISIISRDTLLIISRDKRVKGNRMVWKRTRLKSE